MKIIKNSIKDVSTELELFFEKDEGTNYVIPTAAKFFCHDNDKSFTIANLKEVFFDVADNIEGSIVSIPMEDVEKHIEHCMTYYCDGSGAAISKNKNFIIKRVNTFWNILKKNINLPPTKAYEHYSTLKGYFGIGGMWHFCYIFINKENGLVVYASAYS